MKKLVICAYCGCPTVDKTSDDYERYRNRNFHKHCAELQKERDDFFEYVSLVLGIKRPSGKIYSQAKNFVEKYHYTYPGMKRAMQYLYDVKKHKDRLKVTDKSIGIIPYVYDEAQIYYRKLEEKKKILEAQAEKAKQNEKIYNVKMRQIKDKELTYNLDDIK